MFHMFNLKCWEICLFGKLKNLRNVRLQVRFLYGVGLDVTVTNYITAIKAERNGYIADLSYPIKSVLCTSEQHNRFVATKFEINIYKMSVS